jgi:hypothetical protein
VEDGEAQEEQILQVESPEVLVVVDQTIMLVDKEQVAQEQRDKVMLAVVWPECMYLIKDQEVAEQALLVLQTAVAAPAAPVLTLLYQEQL